MADDRYSWLDEDAAERLLRGERVDAGRGRGAQELDDLLDAAAMAATAPSPDTVLPGEEAAVAAFRQASAARSTRDTAAADGAAGAAEDGIPVVRSVPGGTSRTERSRFGRPFRRGLAVALAGCALGGAAVAAGTGVLPTPFHGGPPVPSPSASVAATPRPLESRAPDAEASDGGTRSPDAEPDPADPASPTASGGPDGSTEPGREDTDDAARIPVPDVTSGQGGLGGGDTGKRAAVLALCRDYEAGRTPPEDRDRVRRLERAAGGAEKLHASCKRYLQQNGLTGGLGGSGPTADGSGGSTGSSGSTGSTGDGAPGDGSGGTGQDEGGTSGGQGGSDDDESHPGYAPSLSPTPTAPPTSSTPTPSATPSPTG
ncbi:hypothetical protein [Streptomyces sclerotialus]|uniref:hypothetical protein n=1 Tax=Streptomyces sclerotialus TaxID=1957 RepID=UPI0004CA5D75